MKSAAGSLVVTCAIFAAALTSARAADPDVQAVYDSFVKQEMPGISIDLLQAAKKEGSLTWYCTVPVFNNDVVKKFNATFPFVHTTILQVTGGPLVAKFMAEARAKTPGADVVEMSSLSDAKAADAAGFVAPYTLTSEGEYNMSQGVPGRIIPIAADLMSIAYNPTRISDADAISLRKWSGLLDPKWSNMQFAIGDVEAGGSTQLLNYYFQQKFGDKLWKIMAKSGYSVFPGGAPETAAVISGAADLAVAVPMTLLPPQFLKGAPVHWVNAEDWLQFPYAQFISVNAQHPNAARLFQEFMASATGQAIIESDGGSSYRHNVKGSGAWTTQPWFLPVDSSKVWNYTSDQIGAAMPDITKQWRAIFK